MEKTAAPGDGDPFAYIEAGSPWVNRHIENLNGKLRDELLDREPFSPSEGKSTDRKMAQGI